MDASEMRKPMVIREYQPQAGEYRPQHPSLAIECDVPRCFAILNALPGHHKWQERTMVFRPTGANIQYIMDNFPSAEWIGEASKAMDDYILVRMEEQTMRAMKHEQLQDTSGYEFKTVPREHQRHGFILSRDRKNFAWLWEMGCGKTKVAIDNFAYLWERDEVDVLVVVAPNGVHTNWIVEEIPAHMPDRIPCRLLTYHTGMNKHDRKMIEQESQPYVLRKRRPCIVVAFNVEGFSSKAAKALIDEFLSNHRCMMVIDESNTIQNSQAKRSEFLIEVGKKATYKRLLNGTPITNGAENLYAQFKFLDPKIMGYDTLTTFRSAFCIMGGFEQHSVVGYRNLNLLADILDGHSHRVLKKDCLDLPEKIYKKHFYEMTERQKLAYETVRKQALEELEELFGKQHGEKLASEIAITKLIRLQQITCGWVPSPASEAPVALDSVSPRLEALLTLMENVDGKAIIWVNAPGSIWNINAITSRIRKDRAGGFVEYHGAVSPGDRVNSINKFQNDRGIKWFVASKAAARGLTLTAADQGFFYTNNYDLMIRQQAEDRCHRIGSEIHEHILYTDIWTTGVDKKIVTSLREKKMLADQITRDPRVLFME